MSVMRSLFSLVIIITFILLLTPTPLTAERSSTNYKIPVDVVGGTGGEANSLNYILEQNFGKTFIQRSAGASYGTVAGFFQAVNSSLSLSIIDLPLAFGVMEPGDDNSKTIDLRITTDAWNGYTLGVKMLQHENVSCGDRYALCQDSGSHYIPNISATTESPAPWSESGLGFTISAGTGVDPKWNSGDNYASIPSSETTIHVKENYHAPAGTPSYDTTSLKFRIDASLSQSPGDYDNFVVLIACSHFK